jgi:hypothetical protein
VQRAVRGRLGEGCKENLDCWVGCWNCFQGGECTKRGISGWSLGQIVLSYGDKTRKLILRKTREKFGCTKTPVRPRVRGKICVRERSRVAVAKIRDAKDRARSARVRSSAYHATLMWTGVYIAQWAVDFKAAIWANASLRVDWSLCGDRQNGARSHNFHGRARQC